MQSIPCANKCVCAAWLTQVGNQRGAWQTKILCSCCACRVSLYTAMGHWIICVLDNLGLASMVQRCVAALLAILPPSVAAPHAVYSKESQSSGLNFVEFAVGGGKSPTSHRQAQTTLNQAFIKPLPQCYTHRLASILICTSGLPSEKLCER